MVWIEKESGDAKRIKDNQELERQGKERTEEGERITEVTAERMEKKEGLKATTS